MVEIYAPEGSDIGKRVNFGCGTKDQVSEIKSIGDISVLKEIYFEIADFLEKLKKSNEVMEEYKYDTDILEAIDENNEIIRRKKEIIELIETRFVQLNRGDIISSLKQEQEKRQEQKERDFSGAEYL